MNEQIDVCGRCAGHGTVQGIRFNMDDSPVESYKEPCPQCGGSGKQPDSLRACLEDWVARLVLHARASEHEVGIAKPSITRYTDELLLLIERWPRWWHR